MRCRGEERRESVYVREKREFIAHTPFLDFQVCVDGRSLEVTHKDSKDVDSKILIVLKDVEEVSQRDGRKVERGE